MVVMFDQLIEFCVLNHVSVGRIFTGLSHTLVQRRRGPSTVKISGDPYLQT